MKFTRKLLSVLLSLVLVLGAAQLPASAAFVDVDKNTNYQEAIDVLVALKLLKGYEDNSFRPDNTITRAEFATVIARMLGLESVAVGSSAATIFTDMMVGGGEHWASGYIKIAYDLGIILGMGDGTFAPDNPVTYEQAVKMLVCALGYEAAAIELGGWPDGYVAQADTLGMLKAINVEKTDVSASRGMVAQLLFNALEIPLTDKQPDGSVNVTTKTLLTNKLGYAHFNNYMLSQVDGTDSVSDSEIRLQEGELAFAQSEEAFVYTDIMTKIEAKSLLGSYVKGYYKIGSEYEANSIIYIAASNARTEEYIILSEAIYDYKDFEIEYYTDAEGEKLDKISISPDAQLMYNGSLYDFKNGSATEKDLSKWLDPNSKYFMDGQLRLLENTGDKKIDTVFIEDYEIYVAKSGVMTTDSISANNYVIYDNYVSGRNVRIDSYSPSITAEFYNAVTGEEMQIEDIKAMHVVCVAANMSGTKFKVYVSGKTVKGKIDEITADGEYIIDGKTYKTTATYENLIETKLIIAKVGAEGTFYLDHNDRICAAKITQEDAGMYAYVTNAGIDDEYAILKLVNLSGSPSTPTKVKCASKVKINGSNVSDAQEILDILEDTAKEIASNAGADAKNTKYAQLIRYVKNASGQISKITTISMHAGEVEVAKNEDMDVLVTGLEKESVTYTSSSGFNSKVFVNSSTLVLVVPDDRMDDAEYKRSTATSYFKNSTKYNIEAYDINPSSVAKVVLVYNAAATAAETAVNYLTPVSIVTKVSSGLSKSDEEKIVYHIEVYQNGAVKNYETEKTGAPYNEIKVGDIIRFGLDVDGRINKMGRSNTGTHELDVENLVPEFKYDISTTTSKPVMYNNSEYYFKSIYGTVSSLADESIFVAPAFVDATGDEPELDVSDAIGFRLNSNVKKYHIRLTDNKTEVNLLSNLNTVIEFGNLKNANATTVFAQAYAGTLKVLVVVVDERTTGEEPADPEQPEEPNEPEEPTEPEEPAEPEEPTEPEDPTDPEEPFDPEQPPFDPEAPVDPEEPEQQEEQEAE